MPELATQQLLTVTIRAYHRWDFLSLLVDIAAGDAPPESLRRFLAKFFRAGEVADKAEAAAQA
ncbi:MAG TPA: hypothetical protein VGG26_03215 [Terracidiphilus sp.]